MDGICESIRQLRAPKKKPSKPSIWEVLLVVPYLALKAIHLCIVGFAMCAFALSFCVAGGAIIAGMFSVFTLAVIHILISIGPFWAGIMVLCYCVSKNNEEKI